MRFFAPVAVVGGPDGAVKVLNDTAESVGGEVVLEYWTYGGRIVKAERFAVAAPPDSATKVGEMHDVGSDAEPVFAVMTLRTPDGAEFVNDWHFRKYVEAPLADARVDIRIIPTTERNGFKVRLSASAPAFFVWANAEGVRGEFDDNAFTLLPGRPRTLTFNAKQDIGWWEFKDRLSVVSLSDLREGFAEPLSKVKYADEIDDGRPSGRWRGPLAVSCRRARQFVAPRIRGRQERLEAFCSGPQLRRMRVGRFSPSDRTFCAAGCGNSRGDMV